MRKTWKLFLTVILFNLLPLSANAAVLTYNENGSYRSETSLAVAATDAASRRVVITGTQIIDTNLTWPADRTLEVEYGGLISIAAGKTLTINGTYKAGLYQTFAGSGTVVFGRGSVKEIVPQWWGAKGDGITDDGVAISKAAKCLQNSGGGILKFPKAKYLLYTGSSYTVVAGIKGVSGISLDGDWSEFIIDPANSYFDTTPRAGSIFNVDNCHNITIDKFYVTGKPVQKFGGSYNGIALVTFTQGSSNINMPHNVKIGGYGCGVVLGVSGDSGAISNVNIGKLVISNNYYGITGQRMANNLKVTNLVTDYVYRSVILYSNGSGINNADITVHSKNPQGAADVLLKLFSADISDLKCKYISKSDSTNTNANTRVALDFIGATAKTAKNITFDFDVEFAGSTGNTVMFAIWKHLADERTGDDTARGHIIQNMTLTGSASGTNITRLMGSGLGLGANFGTWTTGDYWSNCSIRDFVNKTGKSIVFINDSISDIFTIQNVISNAIIVLHPEQSANARLSGTGKIESKDSEFPNQYVGSVNGPPIIRR